MQTGSSTRPRVLLFDWDGTLTDTFDLLFAANNHVLEKMGHALWSEEEARRNIRSSSRELYPVLFGDRAQEASEHLYEYIHEHHLAMLNPFPGSATLLETARQHNIPMGIISNKRQDILEREIAELGWDIFFRVIVGAGVAKRDKPAPDPVLHALDMMPSATTEGVVYLGDTETDMQAAQAAGISFAFLSHGFGKQDFFDQKKPDFAFCDCIEVLNWINNGYA